MNKNLIIISVIAGLILVTIIIAGAVFFPPASTDQQTAPPFVSIPEQQKESVPAQAPLPASKEESEPIYEGPVSGVLLQ